MEKMSCLWWLQCLLCSLILVVTWPIGDVSGQLTTVPDTVANGVLSVCPGDDISITCTHTDVAREITRWEVDGPLVSCAGLVLHNPPVAPLTCSPISFTDINDLSGPSLMSTAMVTVTQQLNDAVVKCLAGSSSSSPQVGNVTINVIDLTATGLSSQQLSTDSTRLSWTIPIEAQSCITSYAVNITGVGVMTTTGTSLTLSTGDGISVNTPYTYTVTSNPGGRQSGPGNFNIINNSPSSPSISQSGVTVVNDRMCSLTSVSVTWEPPIDDPITTPPVTSYQLTCTLEGSTEDVCSGSGGMITATTYQIPVSNFQQLGNYIFSVRALNTAGVSDVSEISYTVSTTTFSTSGVVSLNGVNLTFATNRSCSSPTFQVMLQQCPGAGCTCTSSFMYTDPITVSTTDKALSVNNLVYNSTYCYHASLTVAGTIVGIDDGMFLTLLPLPALMLNDGTARLVSSDPVVVYECVNSIEGFNGNSRQIEATFNQTTGEYSVPRCSVLVWAVVVMFIFVLIVTNVVSVVLGFLCGYYYFKHSRGTGQSSSQPPTELKQVGPIYEEPEDFKPDPTTQGNVAYGHVQPLQLRQ